MGLRRFLMSRPMLIAVVCFAPAQGVMAMMMAGTPLVLDHHGHALPAISLAVTIHVFGMYGLSIPLGRLADRLGRKVALMVGLLIAALGSALVPLTGAYAVIVAGIFLVGVGWSAVFVAATALIADATHAEERGRAIGINDSLAAAFAMALPTLGGVMADSWGLMAVGLVGAGMLCVALPLAWGLRQRELGAIPTVAG
jgi:MFS family permease